MRKYTGVTKNDNRYISADGSTCVAEDVSELVAYILNGKTATFELRDGVELRFRQEEIGWGLSLSIHRRAQWPDMFPSALRRRFVDSGIYDGYFLCIDARNTFVCWYTLSAVQLDRVSIEKIISRLLSLMACRL